MRLLNVIACVWMVGMLAYQLTGPMVTGWIIFNACMATFNGLMALLPDRT